MVFGKGFKEKRINCWMRKKGNTEVKGLCNIINMYLQTGREERKRGREEGRERGRYRGRGEREREREREREEIGRGGNRQ